MIANIIIDAKDPETTLKSLKPDIDENQKFKVELKSKENKIELEVESEDISGLLAGINSYLKLIRTSMEVKEVE